MHDSNPTCICQIINPAPHIVVGAGFDIARLTTQTCLPLVCICQQIQLRKLKTPGGILVFQLLVQVCLPPASCLLPPASGLLPPASCFFLLQNTYQLANLWWSSRCCIMHYCQMCLQPVHAINYVTGYSALLSIRVFYYFVKRSNVIIFLCLIRYFYIARLKCFYMNIFYESGYICLINISVATHKAIQLVCWKWMLGFFLGAGTGLVT